MQLRTILNSDQKFKSFVYGKITFSIHNDKKCLAIEVHPRKNSQGCCGTCGEKSYTYDHLPERKFEFVPFWGYQSFFIYRMRRINCPRCGVRGEQVPWGHGNYSSTKTHMQFLAHWAEKLSWKEVAVEFRSTWDKVFQSVKFVVDWGLKNRDLSNITAIGVDEVAWRKGHDYLTLVYQIDAACPRLLWIGRGRTVKTMLRFFMRFGKERTKQLKFICSDMWKPYLKVIKKKASHTLHILDRFHIVRKLGMALDEVRADEHKRLKRDGHEPVLTNTRWCLLKRKENLTNNQEATLKDLLKYNLKSVRAYLLKADFEGFWDYVSPEWAGKFLDRWCTRAMRSKIDPIKKIAKTLRKHKPLILNWFKAKKVYSSGIVEGLNNRVKLTTRKAYGFRTFNAAEVALYHVLGKLPRPPTTHSYF